MFRSLKNIRHFSTKSISPTTLAYIKPDLLPSLHRSINDRNMHVVKNLVDIGVHDDRSISVAARVNDLEIVKLLTNNGAKKICPNDGFELAISNNNVEMVQFFIMNYDVSSAAINDNFIYAATHGYLTIVEYVANHKNIMPTTYDRAFQSAANRGHLTIMKYIHTIYSKVDTTSALVTVCENHWSDTAVAEFLLNNGANIHVYESAPLVYACKTYNLKLIKFLLDRGADTVPTSIRALSYAVKHYDMSVVEILLKSKVITHLGDNIGILIEAAMLTKKID